jgi:hypothetical protein
MVRKAVFRLALASSATRLTRADHATIKIKARRWSNQAAASTLVTGPAVAGVLLGKASLNSLYGQTGDPPRTVRGFGDADWAGTLGLRRRRMDKIVVFLV